MSAKQHSDGRRAHGRQARRLARAGRLVGLLPAHTQTPAHPGRARARLRAGGAPTSELGAASSRAGRDAAANWPARRRPRRATRTAAPRHTLTYTHPLLSGTDGKRPWWALVGRTAAPSGGRRRPHAAEARASATATHCPHREQPEGAVTSPTDRTHDPWRVCRLCALWGGHGARFPGMAANWAARRALEVTGGATPVPRPTDVLCPAADTLPAAGVSHEILTRY